MWNLSELNSFQARIKTLSSTLLIGFMDTVVYPTCLFFKWSVKRNYNYSPLERKLSNLTHVKIVLNFQKINVFKCKYYI